MRKLGRWPAFTREQITEYSPPHHLAYVILSGLPVRGYHADVDVFATTTGSTIRWAGAFEPKVPGTGELFAMVLGRIVRGFAHHAAREAERRAGQSADPPPRRQKAATRFRSETDRYLLAVRTGSE